MPENTPRLSAIVLSDLIFQDKGTSKHVLAGTFSHFTSPIFPTRLGTCGVYVALDHVQVKSRLTLFLRSRTTKTERVLAAWEILEVPKIGDEVSEIFAQLTNVPFEAPGWYDFVVKLGEVVLGSRSIQAIDSSKG
jgi:hypothetical protein